MMIDFSYAEVIEILAATNRIANDKRGAFKARLRNFQSKGFPPGTNTGKGKAARYSLDHLLQMVIALQLAQVGMSPERIVLTVTNNWSDVFTGLLTAWAPKGYGIIRNTSSADRDIVLSISPEALRDLSNDGESELDYYESVSVFPFSEIGKHLPLEGDTPVVGETYRTVILRLRTIIQLTAGNLIKVVPNLEPLAVWDELQRIEAARYAAMQEVIAEIGRPMKLKGGGPL